MNVIETLISFIAPHNCVACGSEGDMLCGLCTAALAPCTPRCYICSAQSPQFRTCAACVAPGTPTQVWVVTPYDGAAKQLIHALKFGRAGAAAGNVARAIATALPDDGQWLVTHVPTVYARVRQRGYDQAALIARQVARDTGTVYAPLLSRRGSQRQLGQSRAVRQHQLACAFQVPRPAAVANQDILLIDDVITTGSTITAAARALHAAGARSVVAAAFAAA